MKNIFLIKSNRAQASAPFEVLVAVILMGFVIVAGTWALMNLSQSTCIGNKRQSMSELKEAITDVVLGSDLTIKNINFDVQPCFKQSYEFINLVTYNNPTKCNAYCGGGNNCILLEYTYDDEKTRKQPIPPICMDLPTAISFVDSTESCGVNNDDWVAMNLMRGPTQQRSNIVSGKYRLFMQSGTNSNISRQMCFLRKI